jgi:quinol-cytochrome oxidoreductase complex cytochrome b subunit
MLFFFVSFSGYTLPVSLMAFWALVVITNLASAIPSFGGEILSLLWGGDAVSSATLSRFYS